jgi:hypothetical protein
MHISLALVQLDKILNTILDFFRAAGSHEIVRRPDCRHTGEGRRCCVNYGARTVALQSSTAPTEANPLHRKDAVLWQNLFGDQIHSQGLHFVDQ